MAESGSTVSVRTIHIAVIDYGMGNIHSMVKALRLFASDVEYTSDPERIRAADAIVLPGDGAFVAAMRGLEPVRETLNERVESGVSLFGVCIGFQVLFENSDESDDGTFVAGLGRVPGQVRRFDFEDPDVRVPHMGWNRLIANGEARDYMYFIHSYRPENVPADFVKARCDYAGDRFVASIEHENIFATQFHPEKSDRAGLKMIEEWVKRA